MFIRPPFDHYHQDVAQQLQRQYYSTFNSLLESSPNDPSGCLARLHDSRTIVPPLDTTWLLPRIRFAECEQSVGTIARPLIESIRIQRPALLFTALSDTRTTSLSTSLSILLSRLLSTLLFIELPTELMTWYPVDWLLVLLSTLLSICFHLALHHATNLLPITDFPNSSRAPLICLYLTLRYHRSYPPIYPTHDYIYFFLVQYYSFLYIARLMAVRLP